MVKALNLFHHIHHFHNHHEVHHCGGRHRNLDYRIRHCKCGKHNINKKEAKGHDSNDNLVKVRFFEKCPEGGWHIESGKIISK